MSRILFAWELGMNYGHLARQVPISERLRAGGHEVFFAVRDVRVAAEILGRQGVRFVQAPLSHPGRRMQASLVNYSGLLSAIGYGDAHTLSGMVRAWLNLLELVQPDMVEADHAPTALLACRIAGLPALPVGNGFEIPPARSPLPSIRPWESVPPERLHQVDRRVRLVINQLLKEFQAAPLAHITELFESHGKVLATFAELDHYGVREGESYAGPSCQR